MLKISIWYIKNYFRRKIKKHQKQQVILKGNKIVDKTTIEPKPAKIIEDFEF